MPIITPHPWGGRTHLLWAAAPPPWAYRSRSTSGTVCCTNHTSLYAFTVRANASGAASRGPARLRGEPRGPPFFSHVFVITIIRPSQKETSPPVNPRSGFKLFSVRAPEPPKKQSYVYFEPSKRDLIRPRISTSALFDIYCRSKSPGINYD